MNIAEFIMSAPPELVSLAIILAAFISEDAAILAAASLAAMKTVEPRLAFVSSVAGIWLGDLGLYAIARRYGRSTVESDWGSRFISPEAIQKGERWFSRYGSIGLFVSRCMPGTRLPMSLAAGTLRMPLIRFTGIGIAGALVWVAANFLIVSYSRNYLIVGGPSSLWLNVIVPTVLLAVIIVARKLFSGKMKSIQLMLRRWSRWEFWPAWLFYIPVAFMYAWLAIKYRGASLPALANPGQVNGGLVGESKAEILDSLSTAAPEHTAESFLIEADHPSSRLERLANLIAISRVTLPFVLKPNVGQRGAGFKKISRIEDAIAYLKTTNSPMLVQRYIAGPKEIGVFYYRFPGQDHGAILAITDKSFPSITGDGIKTLRELIYADPRASLIAATYLSRFGDAVDDIIPEGETLRLVEAGNHCQGCVFTDGMHLYSRELFDAIDCISGALPGFYIGRYDIRYESDDELRASRGFSIIELNGAASEATSIYDARNSLLSGYRTLYRQWDLVFAIGRANRDRGLRAPSLLNLGRDWLAYSRQAAYYPAAD
jgi:membrane protein DedA with SNARE-associated domain